MAVRERESADRRSSWRVCEKARVAPFPVSSDPEHSAMSRARRIAPTCKPPNAIAPPIPAARAWLNVPGAVAAAQRPIAAVVRSPSALVPGQDVELSDGRGSAAACGRSRSSRYAWAVVARRERHRSRRARSPSRRRRYGPCVRVSFTVRLTVTDDANRQDIADVTVTATTATTTAPARSRHERLPDGGRCAASTDRCDGFADCGHRVRERRAGIHRRSDERARCNGDLAGQRRRGRECHGRHDHAIRGLHGAGDSRRCRQR